MPYQQQHQQLEHRTYISDADIMRTLGHNTFAKYVEDVVREGLRGDELSVLNVQRFMDYLRVPYSTFKTSSYLFKYDPHFIFLFIPTKDMQTALLIKRLEQDLREMDAFSDTPSYRKIQREIDKLEVNLTTGDFSEKSLLRTPCLVVVFKNTGGDIDKELNYRYEGVFNGNPKNII